jgi:tRNA dimethylallyltransferase
MARNSICAIVGSPQAFRRTQLIHGGSHGVGKSRLSIDLAKAFQGQVINGDPLKVYRGANILTNKVTAEQMDGVKHHLMDFAPPTRRYDMFRFNDDAIPIVPQPPAFLC